MAKQTTRLRAAALGLATAIVLGVVGFMLVYHMVGRTPRELFDYVEQRLIGHPKLEAIAIPLILEIRSYLNEPSLKERRALQFNIPPPPPLEIDSANSGRSAHTSTGQRIIRVGTHGEAMTIALAAELARDDDIVEIAASNFYGDVAIWKQKRLTIRGVGGHARIFADGKNAESKAIWVIRDGDFRIENIDFVGAKVADQNGAGIRFENGNLQIRNCLFYGNESGILIGNEPDITVTIENSEFAFNGTQFGQSHAIYAGSISTFNLTGSYLHHSNTGHLIKSRARHSNILYNRITDESGQASYEVNLPNGGNVLIMGNIIQQGRETENSTVISYGEEGYSESNNSLRLINNTVVNDHPFGGTFLKVAPNAQVIISANNLYIGQGIFPHGRYLESLNDVFTGWDIFEQPQRFNYTLNSKGLKVAELHEPSTLSKEMLPIPVEAYSHPARTIKLAKKVSHRGALQPISYIHDITSSQK